VSTKVPAARALARRRCTALMTSRLVAECLAELLRPFEIVIIHFRTSDSGRGFYALIHARPAAARIAVVANETDAIAPRPARWRRQNDRNQRVWIEPMGQGAAQAARVSKFWLSHRPTR